MAHIIAIEGMPASAAGRIGLCKNAIQEALDMGYSKKEIAVRMGLSYMTFYRAWKGQKITVAPDKQLPLPAPVAPLAPVKTLTPVKTAPTSGFRVTHDSSSNNAGTPAKPSGRINIDDPANQL